MGPLEEEICKLTNLVRRVLPYDIFRKGCPDGLERPLLLFKECVPILLQ